MAFTTQWMTNLTSTLHSKFNQPSFRYRSVTFRYLFFFFSCLLLNDILVSGPLFAQETDSEQELRKISPSVSTSSSAQDEIIRIAIFDTGFCPSLIEQNPHFQIEPVKDFTQSNTYKCIPGKLKGFRFHGHWILEYLEKELKVNSEEENPNKPQLANKEASQRTPLHPKIRIYPYILFNNKGDQSLEYWKIALKQLRADKINMAVMAVGLPAKKENINSLVKSAQNFKGFFLMASGQKDIRLNLKYGLFPQSKKEELLGLMLGQYYPALASSEVALLPPAQLHSRKSDFFFKVNSFNQLKNTSLAVTQALGLIIKQCSYGEIVNFSKVSTCLEKMSSQTSAKLPSGKIIPIKALP